MKNVQNNAFTKSIIFFFLLNSLLTHLLSTRRKAVRVFSSYFNRSKFNAAPTWRTQVKKKLEKKIERNAKSHDSRGGKKITITKLPPSCNLVIFVQYVTYLGEYALIITFLTRKKENSEEKERVNPIRSGWTVELLMDSPLQTDSSDQWW